MKLCITKMLRSCVLALVLCIGAGTSLAQEDVSSDANVVLLELEAMAARVAEAPANCDIVREQARSFQTKHGDTLTLLAEQDGAVDDAQLQTRLSKVFEKLSPSIIACGSCSATSKEVVEGAVNKDDPCKGTKKKCERNCPLSGWSCTQSWAGCMSGYRPSCCWAGACGSKKHCMQVCESSCVCSI